MKIFYNGVRNKKLERDYDGRFTSWGRRFMKFVRRVVVFSSMVVGIWVVFLTGMYINHVDTANAEVPVVKEELPPVLLRIAICESRNKHFAPSGQVLLNANTNDTVDVGRFQINTVWFKKAGELKLDLMDEKGNEEMARYIYENKGTGPWSSSSKCWNK